jgi:mRNA interferase RelE/StbE
MYRVRLNKKLKKFVKNLNPSQKNRIKKRLIELSENPLSGDIKKTKGKYKNAYRTRVGSFRILYIVNNKEKEILIARIDKRGRIYKR